MEFSSKGDFDGWFINHFEQGEPKAAKELAESYFTENGGETLLL